MLFPNNLLKDIVYESIWGTFRQLWGTIDDYDSETLEKITEEVNFNWVCPVCGYHNDSYLDECSECEDYSRSMDFWVQKRKYPEDPFQKILTRVEEKYMANNVSEWMLRTSLTTLKNQSRIGLLLGQTISMMVAGVSPEKIETIETMIGQIAEMQSESEGLVQELQKLQDLQEHTDN